MCKHCKHTLIAHAEAEARSNKRYQPTCDECARLHRKRCPGWEPITAPVDDLAIVGHDMGYSPDQHLQKMQEMINSATIWRFEGSMGRAAMDALESGACYLPRNTTNDYWGNRLPARQTLAVGSKGTLLNHINWLNEQDCADEA